MLSEQTKKQLLIAVGIAAVIGGDYLFITSKARAADTGGGRIFADAPLAPAKGTTGITAYVGAHAGVSIATTEVGVDSLGSIDGIGAHGAIGGVHAGLDYTMASHVFVGMFGFYDWQSTKSTFNLGGGSASIGFGDSYGVGGRLGYDWGWAKTYGLVGWRHTDLDWGSLGGGGVSLPGSLTGLDLGVGMETPIAKNVTLGVEGVWTKYQQETIDIGPGINLDSRQLSVMGRLNFQFGG